MAIETVAGLLDSLRGTPILTREQHADLSGRLSTEYTDVQELCRQLIKLKYITLYQAKKILAGKTNELIIGHYVVVDKLGEGGMGRVYKAVQLTLNRIVALKVVRSSLLKNETALKRFRREVKAAAALSHPNIVRVFDADQDGDRHFLAMENIEGADLGRLIKDHGQLPVAVACSYIRQAALGLQHAHDLSFVHRDIKPSNLLVAINDKSQYGPKNVVKILDMGLARMQSDEANGEQISTELTRTGTVVGTPDYMSPEQAKNSSNVDHRSDLYSLGCTFFYLLTGEVVFPKGNPLEKLLQHQLDAPRPIQLIRMDIPPEVASIVQCLLAKKPEQRFQSGSALAHALEPWCAMKGQTAMMPAVAMAAEPVEPQATISLETPRVGSPFNFDDDDTELQAPPPTPREAKTPPRMPPLPKTAKSKSFPWLIIAGIGGVLLMGIVMLAVLKAVISPTKPKEELTTTQPNTDTTPPKVDPKPKEDPKTKEEPKTLQTQDILEKYLPDDSTMVLVFDIKNIANTAVAREKVWQPLQQRLLPVKLLTGIDLFQVVDRVIVSISSDNARAPVIILQGRAVQVERLAEAVRKTPGVKIEKYKDTSIDMAEFTKDKPMERSTHAAAYGTSIIISEDKSRVEEALDKREGNQRTKFNDPSVELALKGIYTQPFLATCVFGMRGPFGELSPAAKDIRFFVAGVNIEERGLHFYTIANESEAGKALEFQKAIGNYLKSQGKRPGKEDPRLEQLGELMTEAKFGGIGMIAKKYFNTHYFIRTKELDSWLAPFWEDR